MSKIKYILDGNPATKLTNNLREEEWSYWSVINQYKRLNFPFLYLPLEKEKLGMPLLEFTSKGIYCKQADVYLDPWRGVDKAIISHGHSDHARWGSKHYITHEINVPIIQHRLGKISVTGKKYGETFSH